MLVKDIQLGNAPELYFFRDGLIYYDEQIYLDPNSPLIPRLLKEMHDTSLMGFTRMTKTYQRLAVTFYWP